MSLMDGTGSKYGRPSFYAEVLDCQPGMSAVRVRVCGMYRLRGGNTIFQSMSGKPDDLKFLRGRYGPGNAYFEQVLKEAKSALSGHNAAHGSHDDDEKYLAPGKPKSMKAVHEEPVK